MFYDDYEKMLDQANLDIVVVETDADVHAAFIIKALERNINVLTDIPVVASLKEAEDLWRGGEVMRIRYPWNPDWTGEF